MGGAAWMGRRGMYTEVKMIAKGGMGVTYEAAGPGGRPVVVKVPLVSTREKPLAPSFEGLMAEKLRVEAQVLRNLATQSPPNIVRYVDESSGQGSFFLAVEKIEGWTMDKEIPSAGLPEDRVVAMSLDVLRALEFLHRRNTIYRDMKPQNVMVRPDKSCVMIDFGGAKQGTVRARSPGGGDHTAFISAGWTCPHQNYGRMSAECDLYAFGRLMFYMGTGVRPSSLPEKMGRPSKTMRGIKPAVSEELSDLVYRMIDPDHGSVHTASEAIRELRALQRQPAAGPVQRVARVAQAAPPRPGAGPAFALSAKPPLGRRAGLLAKKAARGLAASLWQGILQQARGAGPARGRAPARRRAGPARRPAGPTRGTGMPSRSSWRAPARRGRIPRPAPWQAAQRGARHRARAAMVRAARGGRRSGGARIILQGVEYHVSERPGGSLIGKRHDMEACRASGGGCNARGRGHNVFVGWRCPAGCRCGYNPGHIIGKHHMRVWRDRSGRMMVANNDPRRRSAINRGGRWVPMRHGRAEVLRNRDQVALLYNEAKGPYMEFTFYDRR